MRTVRSLLLFVLVLIVVTAGVGLWLVSSQEERTGSTADSPKTKKATSTFSVKTPEGWKTYTAPKSDLTFDYPPKAEVTSTDSGVTVSFLGSENATGQITDGYTLSFELVSLEDQNLQEIAKARHAKETTSGELREVPTRTGKNGVRYITEEVNDAYGTTYILPAGPLEAVVMKDYIADPKANDYRQTVETIRASAWENLSPTLSSPSQFSQVSLPLLDTSRSLVGIPRGCDKVVFQNVDTTATQPLSATYQKLFDIRQEHPFDPIPAPKDEGNVSLLHMIGRMNTLKFERVEYAQGVVNVYLSGELSGLRGACDNPRARIQIEEAALQYPSVHSVNIYLNGEKTELTPNARGE